MEDRHPGADPRRLTAYAFNSSNFTAGGGFAPTGAKGVLEAGQNMIPFWWDMVVVTGLSLIIYWLALRVRLDPERVRSYVRSGESTKSMHALDEA